MGQIYNPDDFLCQMCAYKTCLLENKGRQIIKNKIKQIKQQQEYDNQNIKNIENKNNKL